jgi:creatinine deaminase
MTNYLITENTPIDDTTLNAIAHIPTEYLSKLIQPAFFKTLSDKNFMRIATLLAKKSFDEGGCPIGAVIINNQTREIIGKGHNTLFQENDSTTHGETAALRDAGRVAKLQGHGPVDFRQTTLFTTLTPCVVCCAQINNRCHSERIVIGDITNAPSTESLLRAGGSLNIDILEDPMAINLYKEYMTLRPEQHYIDWGGHKKWDEQH